MKKLFSIECDGLFFTEEENEVYSIYNTNTKSHRFFDNKGAEIFDYQRWPREKETDCSDDLVKDEDDEDDEDTLIFNKYGIACGDNCLVDSNGNVIPNTDLNLEDDCGEYDRYFSFSLINDEQSRLIDECGTVPGITLDYFDTKTKEYVVRGVPECRLRVSFYDGEPEVIVAAAKLVDQYDTVKVEKTGTILATKGKTVTVFYYWSD